MKYSYKDLERLLYYKDGVLLYKEGLCVKKNNEQIIDDFVNSNIFLDDTFEINGEIFKFIFYKKEVFINYLNNSFIIKLDNINIEDVIISRDCISIKNLKFFDNFHIVAFYGSKLFIPLIYELKYTITNKFVLKILKKED